MTIVPVLFVPLDDRPATRDLVLDLARAAAVDVRTPPLELLGTRDRAGDVDGLWSWLEREARSLHDQGALIAAVEMLCFGGLVASRKSTAAYEAVASTVRRLTDLSGRLSLYLSAVIPRTPVHGGGDEDSEHWARYGDALRKYGMALDAARREKRADPSPDGIPAEVLDTVLRQRRRHIRLNSDLIAAAAGGQVAALLIGQDDTTPLGFSRMDREALVAETSRAHARNVLVSTGADELNARLFARWLNASVEPPRVRVLYTHPEAADRIPLYESSPLAQTVQEHIESAGCRVVDEGEDILFWIHNFSSEPQREARDQSGALDAPRLEAIRRELREALSSERVIGLADVAFANGADRPLVEWLLAQRNFGGVVAYAGWNTASNSLGSAIAQSVVVYRMRESDVVMGNVRGGRRMLLARLLDDWGYQSVVRPQLSRRAAELHADPMRLGLDREGLEVEAASLFRMAVTPKIEPSFFSPVHARQVTFPWDRLFEAAIEFEVQSPPGSQRQPVIADYDARWPVIFEEARAAILTALRGRADVVAVEHIGSTSVPGLGAKPIIDIGIGVQSSDDLDRCIEPLRALGYDYIPDGEVWMPNNRYFRKNDAGGVRTHQIHLVVYGSEFWSRHLLFRDYLRVHPETSKEYERLKHTLAREHASTLSYTFAKTDFIRSVEAKAGWKHKREHARAERPGAREGRLV